MKQVKRQIIKAFFARKIARIRQERERLIEECAQRRKDHRKVAHRQAKLEELTCQLIGLGAL